jgi:CPA2 family monovalent cation:H+ antiporter-2
MLFFEVARARSDELFVLSALLVALLAASLTQWMGLSMALGAFLAGMMLGSPTIVISSRWTSSRFATC